MGCPRGSYTVLPTAYGPFRPLLQVTIRGRPILGGYKTATDL